MAGSERDDSDNNFIIVFKNKKSTHKPMKEKTMQYRERKKNTKRLS
jgi:hypothetical protein